MPSAPPIPDLAERMECSAPGPLPIEAVEAIAELLLDCADSTPPARRQTIPVTNGDTRS